MRFEPPRPGEVRICPQCGGRNKAFLGRCAGCGTELGTSPGVTRAALWWPRPVSLPRGVRVALVFGVLLALLAGLYVRQTFQASLDLPGNDVRADSVPAPPATEVAAEEVPDTGLTWVPMARGTDAPILPPPAALEGNVSVAAEGRTPSAESGAAVSENGMLSVTPSEARKRAVGHGKRSFTDDDLDAVRAAEPLPPTAPSPSLVPSPATQASPSGE